MLQKYPSVHLGSTTDCEPVSPAASVQMKVTAGARERQKVTTLKTGPGFECVGSS